MIIALIVIVVLVGIVALWYAKTYNSLVSSQEMVKNSMGQIATQIESRWDAINSLIAATKSYSAHESETLINVTKMRTGISHNSDVDDVNADDQIFAKAVKEIQIVAENYPDLKSSSLYVETMQKIDSYENHVRQSRMIFNDTVTKYNRQVLMFPASLIAGKLGFTEKEYFKNNENKSDMPSWD